MNGRPTGRILQWAESYICAAHRDEENRLHGHTWRIRAYWRELLNIEDRRFALCQVLADLCHRELPRELTLAELLAAHVGRTVDATRVDVWREAEGLGAIWERET